MKIQLSNTRIIKDALTVWYEHGPEVDIVMDLKNLTFAPGSIEELYSFHVLDHLFVSEILATMKNWKACLGPAGVMYVVVDDFEVLARGFVSGDFSIDFWNDNFSHPACITRDSLLGFCVKAGFSVDGPKIWYDDVPDRFKKEKYDLIFEIPNR